MSTVNTLTLFWDIRRVRKQGAEVVRQRQQERLQSLVLHARNYSPYYRRLYRDIPADVSDVRLLPTTTKTQLMAHFDEWATDHRITRKAIQAFVSDKTKIGDPFLGTYLVATTSGTTGKKGVFVVDQQALAVNSVLGGVSMLSWLGVDGILQVLRHKARMSLVVANDGHYVAAAGAQRLIKHGGRMRSKVQLLSAHMPVGKIAGQLQTFRPGILFGYGSILTLLADEQAAGRLQIDPALIVPAGEKLPKRAYRRLSKVFGAKVHDAYGATESPFTSYSCDRGWYHVNSDWVILEPVDANYRPVPRGKASHTTLVTNLANHVQPIIRYDLGDSIMVRKDRCPCGNILPAVRVDGRTAEALSFRSSHARSISLQPLLFATIMDRIPGLEQYQLIQASPTRLKVRLLLTPGESAEVVWPIVQSELRSLLGQRGLGNVSVHQEARPPQQTPSGKHQRIIIRNGSV